VTPDEFSAAQAVISAWVASYVLRSTRFFVTPALTTLEWLELLRFIYPEIVRKRDEAARLAREFYDSQRAQYHPTLPRNDIDIEPYTFERFVRQMEPARKRMSQMDSPQDAAGHMALAAVREVENGGRRQIIRAVEAEPEPQVVKGWARVATGRETCAWCLMLISRGPVYLGADTAGLDLDDNTAQRMIAAGTDVSEFMEQWHPGCDCKVVPVFNKESWPGKAAADRALALWEQATEDAIEYRKKNPGRVHRSGKKRGEEFTFNEDVINALRRRLERGEINPMDYAGLRAA